MLTGKVEKILYIGRGKSSSSSKEGGSNLPKNSTYPKKYFKNEILQKDVGVTVLLLLKELSKK